jgi:hypothetical protein
MLPLILALVARPALPPPVPPSAGAVLLLREVYVLTLDKDGRPRPKPVRVGLDEWSEKRK